MKKLLFVSLIVGSLGIASQANAAMRFGLGLGSTIGTGQQASVNSLVARIEATPKVVGNVGLGFRSESGDFGDSTSLGLSVGGQYRIFTNPAKNLHFHILGGLSYAMVGTTQDITVTGVDPVTGAPTSTTISADITSSEIGLFGGVGAEYFFPGTDQFSMQIDVGPRIDLLANDPDTGTKADGTVLSLAENLSGGILFTYYFNTAK